MGERRRMRRCARNVDVRRDQRRRLDPPVGADRRVQRRRRGQLRSPGFRQQLPAATRPAVEHQPLADARQSLRGRLDATERAGVATRPVRRTAASPAPIGCRSVATGGRHGFTPRGASSAPGRAPAPRQSAPRYFVPGFDCGCSRAYDLRRSVPMNICIASRSGVARMHGGSTRPDCAYNRSRIVIAPRGSPAGPLGQPARGRRVDRIRLRPSAIAAPTTSAVRPRCIDWVSETDRQRDAPARGPRARCGRPARPPARASRTAATTSAKRRQAALRQRRGASAPPSQARGAPSDRHRRPVPVAGGVRRPAPASSKRSATRSWPSPRAAGTTRDHGAAAVARTGAGRLPRRGAQPGGDGRRSFDPRAWWPAAVRRRRADLDRDLDRLAANLAVLDVNPGTVGQVTWVPQTRHTRGCSSTNSPSAAAPCPARRPARTVDSSTAWGRGSAMRARRRAATSCGTHRPIMNSGPLDKSRPR